MRDCYKKYWKVVLVEKMHARFPLFVLNESAARKTADEEKPSTKTVCFYWNPVGKLVFSVEFRVPGKQDGFEATFYWSEKGKAGPNGTADLDHPFAEEAAELVSATVMIQSLSRVVDGDARIFGWEFWVPTRELGSTVESHAAWKAEFMAEEMRFIGDEEARQRVELTVEKTMSDIKRCAMPWFEKKLAWYQQNKAIGKPSCADSPA